MTYHCGFCVSIDECYVGLSLVTNLLAATIFAFFGLYAKLSSGDAKDLPVNFDVHARVAAERRGEAVAPQREQCENVQNRRRLERTDSPPLILLQ